MQRIKPALYCGGRRLCFLLVALCAAAVFAAGLLICPKCGVENAEGALVCAHCSAPLPESAPAAALVKTAQGPAAGADKGRAALDPAVVEAEIAAGAQQKKAGNNVVARFFFRNALALEMLTDPAQQSRRPERILALVKESAAGGLGTVSTPCSVCNGTGKRYMTTPTFAGEAVHQVVAGAVCQACWGAGRMASGASLADWKMLMGRVKEEYRLLQQGRRFVPVGEAWAPQQIADTLGVRQKALLKRTLAAPCPACLGCGREACLACRGSGRLKCSNPKCEDGYVKAAQPKAQDAKKLVPISLSGRERCPTCHRVGTIVCAACGGRGWELCAKCDGTGQRAVCGRCDGEGVRPCGRCNGSGVYRDAPCAACSREGVVLCTACNGDGRKK